MFFPTVKRNNKRIKEVKIPFSKEEDNLLKPKSSSKQKLRKFFLKYRIFFKILFWLAFLTIFLKLIFLTIDGFGLSGILTLIVALVPILSSPTWMIFLKKERIINLGIGLSIVATVVFLVLSSNIFNQSSFRSAISFEESISVSASTLSNQTKDSDKDQLIYLAVYFLAWISGLGLFFYLLFWFSKIWIFFETTKLNYLSWQKYLVILPFLIFFALIFTKIYLFEQSLIQLFLQPQTYFFFFGFYLYQTLISFLILPKNHAIDQNLLKLSFLQSRENPLLKDYNLKERRPPHIYKSY